MTAAKITASNSTPPPPPRKRIAGPGRPSKFKGHTLHKLTSLNPRKRDSHGFKSWACYKSGATYEQFIKAGGRAVDLKYDIRNGWVETSAPGDSTPLPAIRKGNR